MLDERGAWVDRTTIHGWTQRHAPEIERRLPWHSRRPRSTRWRADETCGKVRGRWASLDRAMDTRGTITDFPLSPIGNAKAARRFLARAPRGPRASERPVTIKADGAASYGPAVAAAKTEGRLSKEVQHRPVQSLDDRLEADRGKLTRLASSPQEPPSPPSRASRP